MSALEVILRTLGVVQLALLAGLLLRTRRRDHTARIGAALCISVAAFLLTSVQDAADVLGLFTYPLTAICSTHPVWFWLFCSALFADGRKLSRAHLTVAAGMAIVGSFYQLMMEPAWRVEAAWLTQSLGLLFGAASLGFACLAPVAVFAGRRDDLDERRRRIRTWFIPVVTAYLAGVIVVQAISIIASRSTPLPLVLANLAFIDVLAALALLSFVQVRVVNWLDLVEPAPDVGSLSRVEQRVLERLTRRVQPERLYAREALTITALAELLDTQEYVLRRVINRGLGFRNFNDFLHSHRLREAAARLRDPAARRLPVLTIALESGYASIGPFNRAFKERFGMTPTGFRRASADEQRQGPASTLQPTA